MYTKHEILNALQSGEYALASRVADAEKTVEEGVLEPEYIQIAKENADRALKNAQILRYLRQHLEAWSCMDEMISKELG